MPLALAAATPPAEGAAFHEILIAGAIAGVVILFFGWVTLMERTGKPNPVGALADWAARISGLPRWVALPAALGPVSIFSCGWGVWWDVPLHMQRGRDAGPLANPSHYPIFLGILGFCHAGILSMALARDPLPRHTIRLAPGWRVPLGAVIITGAGLIALVGFPADDFWHRFFGQDVTEWGPTHTMMIGGAVTFVLGIPLLLAEAAQVGTGAERALMGRIFGHRVVTGLAMALCGIPFAFLMEFDLGVPQFPAATQFIIFGFLAAWICTAVRLWIGPGGALLVAAGYLVVHGFLWLGIEVLPDVLTARFLLLVPSAIIVELVGLALRPRRSGRAVPFALVSGLLVGSLGMYAEWLWSKVFMPLPQPFNADTLPFLLALSTPAALGGGFMGLWMLSRITLTGSADAPSDPKQLPYRGFGLVGLVLFVVLMGAVGVPREGDTYKGVITYSDVSTGAKACDGEERCLARVTVTFQGEDKAEGAVWFYALSWQGNPHKGAGTDVPTDPTAHVPGIVRTELEPTGTPGQYTTKDPVPVYGQWKTLLRLHRAPSQMVSFPIYAPDDPAIKAATGRQVLVADGATVETQLESTFLQREKKDNVPAVAFTIGYLLVLATWLAMFLFYGWCYNRAALAPAGDRQRTPTA